MSAALKLDPTPAQFHFLPNQQLSTVLRLPSPKELQSLYQIAIPIPSQNLDLALRSQLVSNFRVFFPISKFIPNNQSGLTPTLIVTARAHPISNPLHQQFRGEQSAKETAELFQQM